MDGALRLLAGNGVVELVLPRGVVRGYVPCGLGDGWTAEDHVGGPLIGGGAVLGISGALAAIGEAVGFQSFAGEGSGGEGDCRSQLVSGLVAAEFAGGGAVDEGDVGFLAGREDEGGLLRQYVAVDVRSDAGSDAAVELGQSGEQIGRGERAKIFNLVVAGGALRAFSQSRTGSFGLGEREQRCGESRSALGESLLEEALSLVARSSACWCPWRRRTGRRR